MSNYGKSVYLEWIACVLCLLYIIALSFDHLTMTEKEAEILHYIDFVFAVLFVIETAIRFHSLRRSFLSNLWNFYDSIVTILLLIGKF